MNFPIKYRPLRFDQIVGQEIPIKIAQASINSDELQSTYLLVGGSGTGKTTLARIMARSLNCRNRDGVEPCNECDNCQAHLNGQSLAIAEINGSDKNGVDDVRELIESCQVHTLNGTYRVVILDECHQMSKPAQNAMLKLLEDPPLNTVFILCTTEEDKLLETIRSRARILRFHTVAKDLVVGFILNIAYHEGIALTEQEAEKIYEYNKGSIRKSLQTLSSVSSQLTVAELCPSIDPNDLKSLFIAFDSKDYLAINSTLQKIVDLGFYPKQILIDSIDLAIDTMAQPNVNHNFVFNCNKMIEIILPIVNNLGINSSALTNCRLALYQVLNEWDSSTGVTSTTQPDPQPTPSQPIPSQPFPSVNHTVRTPQVQLFLVPTNHVPYQ